MIALTIQYHAADRDEADRLLRLIAQIEPERREDVKLRLVARKDCGHVDMSTIQTVGRRFDVTWGHTSSDESGWPAGPNAMACEIVATAPDWLHEVGWSQVDALFMLEPDVVPLSRTWIADLSAEWDRAKAEGKSVMGAWRNSGGAYGHINGNCILGSAVWGLSCFRKPPRSLAWDCHIAPYVRNKWHPTGLIRNDFQGLGATEEKLRTPEAGDVAPVLVHGYKDASAREIARRWMKL